MDGESRRRNNGASRVRIVVMLGGGLLAAAIAALLGAWPYALIIGWAVCCATYLVWVWVVIGRADAERTRELASREDPSRTTSDLLLLIAAVASLVGLVAISLQTKSSSAEKGVYAAIAGASVVLSWTFVHTLYTLRYAVLYVADESRKPIDFNQSSPPTYVDFAYLSFTIGMTFQVSDNNISSASIRSVALRHSILSYLFGAVILAAAVNLVSSLV
jgi:uncharacterized membrane protein